MYIIELACKILKDIKDGKYQFKRKINIEKEETCNHLFLPIDSTKRILACAKCGKIYKLKFGEKNPFEK